MHSTCRLQVHSIACRTIETFRTIETMHMLNTECSRCAIYSSHTGQFAEAERHFVVAGCADAAVHMWLLAGAVEDALRVAAEGGSASTLAAAQEAKVRHTNPMQRCLFPCLCPFVSQQPWPCFCLPSQPYLSANAAHCCNLRAMQRQKQGTTQQQRRGTSRHTAPNLHLPCTAVPDGGRMPFEWQRHTCQPR